MKTLTAALLLISFAALGGCTSGSEKAGNDGKKAELQEQAKKSQTKAGRSVFQTFYVTARTWAPDAQPVNLQSEPTKDANGHDGKAAIWHSTFASVSRGMQKPFTWSGSVAENAPEPGLSPGTEDSFSPDNVSTRTFDASLIKIDADKAFEVSQEHGGKAETTKNAAIPIVYQLAWDPQKNQLIWHVLYGGNMDPTLRVAVNATSGAFVRVEK